MEREPAVSGSNRGHGDVAMNIAQLERLQEEWAQPALGSLVQSCRRRYLRAANLLQVRNDEVSRLRGASPEGGADLSPLLPFWSTDCSRYRKEAFDPQEDLFREHGVEIRARWRGFVYQELWPMLYREAECVRNVLRGIGLLRSLSSTAAVAALVRFVEDLELPLEHGPGNDVEDE